LTDDELCSDAHTMVSAGSDTAGLTLALGIFYIYKNSEIRKRLHNELGAAYPHSSDVLKAHWADLEKLPFLSACVYESLRIAVPIGGDLPRVVTGGDWQFKGIRIPAGTVVSSSANAVNLNGDIFPEPQRFIPERWLDEQGRLSNAKETWLVSFSKGPRACIG
ncbi:cytochrome P450, partial [Gloeophyllum trabeum ATCC 11539]